jgi:DNA-binding PadR family transcriptional regulator
VLRGPTFLILTVLAGGPLHGYGVIRSVAELSDGRVTVRAGTLYAALDRLVGDGSLAVDGEEVVEGRKRRYYRITEAGLEVLRSEVVRLASNVGVARRQLGAGPALGRT